MCSSVRRLDIAVFSAKKERLEMKKGILVLLIAIGLDATSASANTWYDGGSGFGGFISYKPDCPESQESPAETSPAETYQEIKGNTGETPELVDHGDQVEVKRQTGKYITSSERSKPANDMRLTFQRRTKSRKNSSNSLMMNMAAN
jgi:hypothetical protein